MLTLYFYSPSVPPVTSYGLTLTFYYHLHDKIIDWCGRFRVELNLVTLSGIEPLFLYYQLVAELLYRLSYRGSSMNI